MLRLPKLTDYAVIILSAMARTPGVVHTTPAVAGHVGLPLPTVAKILKKLTRGGLLQAQRGSHGGYRLVRGATEMTVADIVTALDGPVALTDCVDGRHGQCSMESRCAMHGQWNTINRAITEVLAAVTLADMQSSAEIRPVIPRLAVSHAAMQRG